MGSIPGPPVWSVFSRWFGMYRERCLAGQKGEQQDSECQSKGGGGGTI